MYRSITIEEIREVARKYLNPNQRLFLRYLPEEEALEVVPAPKSVEPVIIAPQPEAKKSKKEKKSKRKKEKELK
jgi:hypothetical protein